jgi:hypothetical protein
LLKILLVFSFGIIFFIYILDRFLGCRCGWLMRLTISLSSVGWLSRKYGSLYFSQHYGPSQSLTGIDLSLVLGNTCEQKVILSVSLILHSGKFSSNKHKNVHLCYVVIFIYYIHKFQQ